MAETKSNEILDLNLPSEVAPERRAEIARKWDELIGDDIDPIFKNEFPENPADDPRLEALMSLVEDESPERTAEYLKDQGNQAFRKKEYQKALWYYTKAIEEKSTIPTNVATYYANRAQVHLAQQNYGYAVRDCVEAVTLDPKNIKAYWRGAKAAIALKKYQLAMRLCEEGLAVDPTNKELHKEHEVAQTLFAEQTQQEEKRRAASEETKVRSKSEKLEVAHVLRKRYGVKLGPQVYHVPNMPNPDEHDPISVDMTTGALCTSALFLYDVAGTTDFVESFSEHDKFSDHFRIMFAEPPPWDRSGAHRPDNLVVFYEADIATPLVDENGEEMKAEQSEKNKKIPQMVLVSPDTTLGEVLRRPDYVVPGMPVFHVVPREHVKKFLESLRR